MDAQRVNELTASMDSMPTDKLLAIWRANNREEYSDEAFDAISRILGKERSNRLPKMSMSRGKTNSGVADKLPDAVATIFSGC